MSKKAVLTALGLITLGIVIGALLVANIGNGVDSGFALGSDDLKLGGATPIQQQNPSVKALSDNFSAVAKAVTPCVVAINVTTSGKPEQQAAPRDFFHFWGPEFKMPEQGPQRGEGSGVIITTDGYIATNNHVVAEADKDGIEVVLFDKVRYKAKLVGVDPTTDLAVVKIDAKNLIPAALGNSDVVQVGEWVLAIGNPLELEFTVTAGIISARGRNINMIREGEGRTNYGIEDFLQTDAAINPGNSGGALVNMNGEVIGINTAIATTNARYQGYGFAVPVNLLRRVAADLIKHGEVRRGYIGVTISTVDQRMADALGLKEAKGVFVQGTVKGGAGENAGLKERDVILTIDGRELGASNELQSYVATKRIGEEVLLKVFRDGKIIEKRVTLKARDTAPVKARNEAAEGDAESTTTAGKSVSLEKLGMSVRALSSDEKNEREVDYGVLVASVKPYSEAFNRGISQDMVILEADKKKLDGPADLKKIVDGHKPGDSILMRVKVDQGMTTFVAVQIPQ